MMRIPRKKQRFPLAVPAMKTLFLLLLLCSSGMASAQITVAAPTGSPTGGTYSGNRYVTLSTTTTGTSTGQPNAPYPTQLVYSTAGTPTYLSTHYANPVGVTASETIQAYAFLPIIQQSPGTCAPSTGVHCGESQTATTSSTSPWPDWKAVCDATGGSCGGGNQVPASTVHAIVTTLPGSVATLSGSATQFGQTANGTSGQYNSLWVYKAAGPSDPPICTSGQCTYFYEDYYIYFPSTNAHNQGEMENDIDDFDNVTGYQNVWGTQCNLSSGFWQYSNQSKTGWQTSAVPCNDGRHSGTVNMPQNNWIHIQKGVHLTTTGCLVNSATVPAPSGSGPCLYFDYLAINGTVYPNWGKVVATQTGASFTLATTQFQMDMNCATCSINEYIDKASITAGQISPMASFAYTIDPLTATLPMTVTSANPTLLSTYLTAPGSPSSLTVGQTLQFSLFCHYSSGPDQNCTGTDIYGDAATSFTSSNTAVATIGAAGSANAGLVTAVAPGSDSIQATIGGVSSSTWGLTISNPPVTLSNISLATTGSVTSIAVGQTNQLRATCTYSDGSTTSCNTADSHGNYAAGWMSSNSSLATISGSGLVAGVATGSATFSAAAGGHTSAALPLTVNAIPPGTYTITITGPVTLTGTVTF
jgi:Bacterial Ig-like domain (group 2)